MLTDGQEWPVPTTRFVILLLPHTRLSSWGAGTDALDIAHRLLVSLFGGRTDLNILPEVVTVSVDGKRVDLAHGGSATPDLSIDEVRTARGVFVANFEKQAETDADRRTIEAALPWLRLIYSDGAIIAGAGSAAHVAARACLQSNGVAALPQLCQLDEKRRRSGIRLAPADSVIEDHGVITTGASGREPELLFRFLNRTMSSSAARWFAKSVGVAFDDESVASNNEIESHDPLVARAQQWMRERYWKSFNVRDVAGQSAVSARTLTRRFQKSLSMSPHQYLVEIRIEAAKRLIARTQLSVAEIGNLVGYPDLKHFRQAFQARVGKSPAQYRKENGQHHARSSEMEISGTVRSVGQGRAVC